MKKIKYIILKNKMIIIITTIILICGIAIAIGVYSQFTSTSNKSTEEIENKDYENLEDTFEDIFTNTINLNATANQSINYDDIIYCKYNINTSKDNYDIVAKIPFFKLNNDVTNSINSEIYSTFGKTIIDIVQNSTSHTIFNLDYVAYVNNNIISLVIRCKYKDGGNAQRYIVKTYNYDLENNKLLTLNDILEYKSLNSDDVQDKIISKISEKVTQNQAISNQGYNVYLRDVEDDMYKLENTTNFFLGKNDYLYIVYAYGNSNFTSEIDVIIF